MKEQGSCWLLLHARVDPHVGAHHEPLFPCIFKQSIAIFTIHQLNFPPSHLVALKGGGQWEKLLFIIKIINTEPFSAGFLHRCCFSPILYIHLSHLATSLAASKNINHAWCSLGDLVGLSVPKWKIVKEIQAEWHLSPDLKERLKPYCVHHCRDHCNQPITLLMVLVQPTWVWFSPPMDSSRGWMPFVCFFGYAEIYGCKRLRSTCWHLWAAL